MHNCGRRTFYDKCNSSLLLVATAQRCNKVLAQCTLVTSLGHCSCTSFYLIIILFRGLAYRIISLAICWRTQLRTSSLSTPYTCLRVCIESSQLISEQKTNTTLPDLQLSSNTAQHGTHRCSRPPTPCGRHHLSTPVTRICQEQGCVIKFFQVDDLVALFIVLKKVGN